MKSAGNLAGNGTRGREISCLFPVRSWLLRQGAGQLSAPNLYQLSKYSVVLTLAARLHGERIQGLIDGSWSSA